jgi:HNH endonuclease/NUMOD4 motif
MADKFERWLPVVGYEGLYEVSDAGRIRRVGRAARSGNGRGGGARIGLIQKPQPRPGGYLSVQLWKDGKVRNFLVHVLVAKTFIGPAPKGMEVNHDDGDKSNCALSNLEYLTRADNMKHAYRTGLRVAKVPKGETHHAAKLTMERAREIRRRYQPRVCTLKMLAHEFGLDHKTVHSVVSHKTWRESV